jgi:hypothetical protein
MTRRTHILLIDVHDEKDGTKEGFFSSQYATWSKKNVCCATRSVDIKHIIAFNENHSPLFLLLPYSFGCFVFCVGHPTYVTEYYLFNGTKGS